MKPYSLLLATSSLLIADQWVESPMALAQAEPEPETGDATQIHSQQGVMAADQLFIHENTYPDVPLTEPSLSGAVSPSDMARSPMAEVAAPSAPSVSSGAIALPELMSTDVQWTSEALSDPTYTLTETVHPIDRAILDVHPSIPMAPNLSESQPTQIQRTDFVSPALSLADTISDHEAVDSEAIDNAQVVADLAHHDLAHHDLASRKVPDTEVGSSEGPEENIAEDDTVEDHVPEGKVSEGNVTERATAEGGTGGGTGGATTDDHVTDKDKTIGQVTEGKEIDSEGSDSEEEERQAIATTGDPEQMASNYLRPPRLVPNESVPVFLTAMPLNGSVVHHQIGWQLGQEFTTGSDRNTTFFSNGTYRLGSRIRQSVSSNNVFTSDLAGSFVQTDTVRRQREVKIEQRIPQTMLGLHMQQTFTGSCVGSFAETSVDEDDQCTLIPALVTDRDSLNEFFIPTRIDQPGHVGNVISRDSLDTLAEDGFQNIGVEGEAVGLDLYFPNIGLISRQSIDQFASSQSASREVEEAEVNIERREDTDSDQVVFLSRVRQKIQTNDSRSIIGRTVRGQGFINNDDNFWLNALVAAATELLPTTQTRLAGSSNPVNTQINRNLFRAANNHWTPGNSWTLYHAGFGATSHSSDTDKEARRSPNGHYHGVWVGLSPVTERRRTSEVYLDATGPEEVIADEGGEGGSDANINFISDLNGETFDSEELDAFYSQIYLRFLRRDVDLVASDKLVETTTYRPHLSFSGNVTNANQSFRYYVGAIAADDIKAYLGGDFTRHTSRWRLNLGGVGYLNPDRDYFSRVQGSVGRQFRFSNRSNITLFSGLRYAIDQSTDPLDDPVDNFVSFGARTNLGPISLGITQYIGAVLPESIDSSLGADLALRLGKRAALRGYYSPTNSQLNYGVSADYRLGDNQNSPILSFGWTHNGYDFGEDVDGNELTTDSNTFTLQMQFGGQRRPF